MTRDRGIGTLRFLHANGASFFFISLYIHIGRGLYFGSYSYSHTWSIGVSILLATIATAFLGYVLPWGQISFWGASVITGLFSAIPLVGDIIAAWIWGRVSVDSPTLTRFFALHFLLPIVIVALVLLHVTYLHASGANKPLGITKMTQKVRFAPFYALGDVSGFIVLLTLLLTLVILGPDYFGDPENFIEANNRKTPLHIMPEWYYLFAYAILRSIPRKLGGVLALVLRIVILYTLPFASSPYRATSSTPLASFLFWTFTVRVILLTWIGARPVEFPYTETGQILTLIYFSFYLLHPYLKQI